MAIETPSNAAVGIDLQRGFWNRWNAAHRESEINEVSRRQAEVIGRWLDGLRRTDLRIIEVGCGAAWFTPSLTRYGSVVATDLADELLARARQRVAQATFVPGDFLSLDFGPQPFDVAVSLEVLSHVPDQPGFLAKIAGLLRPGGYLMMATQNAPVLRKYNAIPPPEPGQLRRWVSASELRSLLKHDFDVRELFSVTPRADHGFLRRVLTGRVCRPARRLLGAHYGRIWERLGFGWTLMVLARRKPARGR